MRRSVVAAVLGLVALAVIRNGASLTLAEPQPPAKAADRPGWDSIISAEDVEAEVQEIRKRLRASLLSIAKYNANYKDIQVDGAEFAMLGGVASDHGGKIPWKADAADLRELGVQLEIASQSLGKRAYDSCITIFENIELVLDGKRPADWPQPAKRTPFSETADRTDLMRRLDCIYQWAKKNPPPEKAPANPQKPDIRELTMMTVIAIVVASPGYPSADEEDYQKHARGLSEHALALKAAAARGDRDGYSEAFQRVSRKCDQCHVDYRFGDK